MNILHVAEINTLFRVFFSLKKGFILVTTKLFGNRIEKKTFLINLIFKVKF